jgi:predicted nucleic acid-binding protein
VFGADPTFGARSKEAIRLCLAQGSLVACEIVWAEVSAAFGSSDDARDAMHRLTVDFSPMDASAAMAAGTEFRAYRKRGGARARMVADFLIGAHALTQAERLLTRDRGLYRTYFTGLSVLDPSRSTG